MKFTNGEWGPMDLQAVLFHEMCHVCGDKDPIFGVIQYWGNPYKRQAKCYGTYGT